MPCSSHEESTQAKTTAKKSKERIRQNGEVFTPMELCLQMVREIPDDKLNDPSTTYLDNSCGDGNFLVAIMQVLTEEYGIPAENVRANQLFGIDIMPDNIAAARERLGLYPGHPGYRHLVCHDALSYDYEFDGSV